MAIQRQKTVPVVARGKEWVLKTSTCDSINSIVKYNFFQNVYMNLTKTLNYVAKNILQINTNLLPPSSGLTVIFEKKSTIFSFLHDRKSAYWSNCGNIMYRTAIHKFEKRHIFKNIYIEMGGKIASFTFFFSTQETMFYLKSEYFRGVPPPPPPINPPLWAIFITCKTWIT